MSFLQLLSMILCDCNLGAISSSSTTTTAILQYKAKCSPLTLEAALWIHMTNKIFINRRPDIKNNVIYTTPCGS